MSSSTGDCGERCSCWTAICLIFWKRFGQADSGVRPIELSETWHRFAGISPALAHGWEFSAAGHGLAPLQVGVGTIGGTETLVL